MKKQKELKVFEVAVERERRVKEMRTVRVIAYTADSAKMIAKQRRPNDGWEHVRLKKNLNSAETTTFGPSYVLCLGDAVGLPSDGLKRHELLNDPLFVVKVKGEY